MTDQMSLRPAAGPDPKDAAQVVRVDADDANGENNILDDDQNTTNPDEAAIIEYFGLHDVTTTSGSGDVIVTEIPSRAYDTNSAHWLDQPTTTPISGSPVTQQSRLFASGEEIRNRKYYGFDDVGAYGASGIEARPPPS